MSGPARPATAVLRYGDRAVLVECADGVDPIAVRDALLASAAPGVLRVVPAARTVLAEIDPAVTSVERLDRQLADLRIEDRPESDDPVIDIDIRYDGPDLSAIANELGLDVDTVVDRHSSATYRVAFCGFAPGFAYLRGLHPTLHVPRLREPRTAVPAGAVAVADEFTAVYPRRSPGGWRLIGSTDAALWQVDRDPPALLTPGATVRFVPS